MMEKSDTTMTEKSDYLVGEPLNRRWISDSNREKLREAWPIVKSLLEEVGISCSMDTVDSAVTVESLCSTDPLIMRKANYLFQLLCKTTVPAPLAIELALQGRQHDHIKLGTQNGGMCKKNGINKELEDLTHCTLFLDKSTLTAVGPSPRLWWVRNVWNFSITGKLSPAHVIRVFNRKLKRTTMKMGNSDTMMMGKSDFCVLEQPKINHQVSHPLPMQNSDTILMEESDLCVLEQPKFSHKLSDPFPITEKCDFGHLEQPKFSDEFSDPLQMESCRSFRLISPENQAKLKEAWPMVESSLEELGYMCAMSTVDSTVLVVSPGSTDPDIMRKAKYLFKLLCKTPVPAPLAIELALHGRQHDLIKLGTQKGGMCKKYGINRDEFHKLQRRLKRSLKELEALTHCTLFLDKTTLTAVGPSPRLRWVRNVLKFSIPGKLSPAHVIRVFNRKLKKTKMIMANSDTTMMEKSDFCDLERPNFNNKDNDRLLLQNSDTVMMEKSDFCILEQPKFDHAVSDPFLMKEKSEFGVREQPKFNDEVCDPLPMDNSRSFRPISAKNRAKLKEAWPMVESSLVELGCLCAMSTVDSTVSLVLPWTTDLDITRKADYLFKLLFKTPVPARLAMELALGGRQHDLIKLGLQKGGICKKYGMKKEEFDRLWRRLKRSLMELEDLTHCTLFLNKNTLTAVGPSPRLGWVRRVLKICITEKLSPSHVISVFICKHDQRISFVRNVDVLNVKKTGHLMIEDGAAEVTLSFLEGRATRMEGALAMVKSSLEKYGISCTLDLINRTLTISTTEASKEYPDAFEKARHLLQLLTTTNVPPALAIDLALNGKQHEFIEIGFQEGGLCSMYGIKKEQYCKRLKWLTRSVKGIRELTGCDDIYCSASGGTITAVSPSRAGLVAFRKVVLTCIVEDTDPAYFTRKASTRKLKKSIKRLLA